MAVKQIINVFAVVTLLGLFISLWNMKNLLFFNSNARIKKESIIKQESKEMLELISKKIKIISRETATTHHLKSLETSRNPKIDHYTAKRMAVTCYLPDGETNLLQFILLLYGSWKFVSSHVNQFYFVEYKQDFRLIDLLVFCHPSACAYLPSDCKKYYPQEALESNNMNCWFFEQLFEVTIDYPPLNSYIMFNRTDTDELFKPYERILRSDYDVFITPALLTWKLRKIIIFGQGGYCDPFNMKRLKEIAKKLGLRHQGIHCIGSTWYGETDVFIKVARKAFEMTEYMFVNEFDPKLPGLETIPFNENPDGEWIRWWRPVSLLYGCELAFNHLVDHLTKDYKGKFDTPSCRKEGYLSTPHIHCWHDYCDFDKFSFINDLRFIIESRDKLSGEMVHRIIKNSYIKDIKNLTIHEYANYIAWGGVEKYLQRWFK